MEMGQNRENHGRVRHLMEVNGIVVEDFRCWLLCLYMDLCLHLRFDGGCGCGDCRGIDGDFGGYVLVHSQVRD